MKKLLTLFIILSFVFSSCQTKQYPAIKYSVPESLQSDASLNKYFTEYSKCGGVIIGISKELSGGPSLLKMGKTTAQMSKATDRINELKALKPEISDCLSSTQQKDFEKVMCVLDASIGQMRTDINAFDESEYAAIEKKKAEQQTELDAVAIAQEVEIGEFAESESSSDTLNMPGFMNILFPILAIVGFLVIAYFSVFKNIKNKVSEIGYAMGEAKDKYAEAKEKIKEMEAEGKEMSAEEKKAFEFLDKHLQD